MHSLRVASYCRTLLFGGLCLMGLGGGRAGAADKPARGDGSELPPAATIRIDFVRDIQPIFAQRCYRCHGVKKAEAGLRLDLRSRAFEGGDRGPSIQRNNSFASRLIHYVAGIDDEIMMPPKGRPLSDEQIGRLRAWIDQGAKWPQSADAEDTGPETDHWAFQRVKRPAEPGVKNDGWVRNPIDRFVLAKLENLDMEPSPEAARGTLVRRLYLDLLGLPPSPAEVDAVVRDSRSGAYDRLVDRLLESPHFGERWGRHWLDLARYADSDGYEKDNPRPHAWRWRDWVIDAINRDLPFDRFTIEQLAGDLLPNATLDQRVATGFHRNTLTNTEGGVDREEFRLKAVKDRVFTTGAVWLGLTVQCAECHSHKFDPFTQREYYGLVAFFNSAQEVDIRAPLPEAVEAYRRARVEFDEAHAALQAGVAECEKGLAARQAEWERKTLARDPVLRWTVLEPVGFISAGGAGFAKLADHSIRLEGSAPDKDVYTVVLNTECKDITAVRLEVLRDAALPENGPGRAENGNFVLSELTLTAAPLGDPTAAVPVALQNARADHSQDKYPVAHAIDGKANTGWAVLPKQGAPQTRTAIFETQPGSGFAAGTTLICTLRQMYGSRHTLGRFRVAVTNAPRADVDRIPPDAIVDLLTLAPEKRSGEQKEELARYYRSIDPAMRERERRLAAQAKRAPKPPGTKAQVFAEMPDPRETYVHTRGDFRRPGPRVQPHTLAVLHPLRIRGTRPDRLDLAHWLVDPANPLTPRVAVNRIWQHLFGRGLVATPWDFGTQGAKPSHPKLLDWLATEYIRRGWSRKAMIKLIVQSATYRQASRTRSEFRARDPNNDLLAQQNRFRLDAEIIRDLYLSVSGLLYQKMGGPSVRPPLPAGVAALGYAGSVKWRDSEGPDPYRRGMYIFFRRSVPYPMLTTFDAPESTVVSTQRDRSNTPLQALTLLNDPVFVECAQNLGRRIMRNGKGRPEDRIRHAYRLCLAREPSTRELTRVMQLFEEMVHLYRTDPASAARLAGLSESDPADVIEMAAWVAVSRTLLNLDEFVTRE